MKECLPNVHVERDQLFNKLTSLKSFITSKDYNELDQHQRDLLIRQKNLMEAYEEILEQRIVIYNDEYREEYNDTLT